MTTFSADIRPLFRTRDVDAMRFALDLSSYEDVRANADAIYERLSQGTMPCDGPWPPEQTARFQAWMQEGFPE